MIRVNQSVVNYIFLSQNKLVTVVSEGIRCFVSSQRTQSSRRICIIVVYKTGTFFGPKGTTMIHLSLPSGLKKVTSSDHMYTLEYDDNQSDHQEK